MINNGTIDTYYPAFRCPNKEVRHFGIDRDTVNCWIMLDKKGDTFGIILRPDCWVPNRFIVVYNEAKTLKEWLGNWRFIKCHVCGVTFSVKDKEFADVLTFMKDVIDNKKDLKGLAIKVGKTPKAIESYLSKMKEILG